MHVIKGRPKPLIVSVVFLLGVGCGGTQQDKTAPQVTIATTSPSAAQSLATPDPAETAQQETTRASSTANRCAPDGAFPPLPLEPKPAAPLPCRPAEVAAEKTMTTDMKARYQPGKDKSTVVIKFGCDGLDRFISRVVLETGVGHGGGISIIEISRSDPNAIMYDVMGVRLSPSMVARPKAPFEIVRSTLSQEAVFGWMPLIRAALRTTIEEIEAKPDPKSRTGSGSAFGSTTGDFHVLVRVEDGSARVMEGQYTGYEGSVGQARYLPLQRAREALEQALGGLTWYADSPPEEVQHVFERRFVDAQKRFSDSSAWWVRERFVKLAAHVGTRALIPSLLPLLTPTAADASSARTRVYAFEALAALTGWDPRAPKHGEHPRTAEAAANDFVVECGKVRLAQ
ncbi:MAG TPA: hypothetical protein PK156_41655 [Polyangium sp.]|nr:hypothetical protein [Polyangium sp.]